MYFECLGGEDRLRLVLGARGFWRDQTNNRAGFYFHSAPRNTGYHVSMPIWTNTPFTCMEFVWYAPEFGSERMIIGMHPNEEDKKRIWHGFYVITGCRLDLYG